MHDEAKIGTLSEIVIDAADFTGLADFYARIAGFRTVLVEHDWVSMATPQGWRVAIQSAPDHLPPRWPDSACPQQLHLDLSAPDLSAAVAAAERAGATRLPGGGESHVVLADPAGHPFCLVERRDPQTGHGDAPADHGDPPGDQAGVTEAGITLAGVCLDAADGAALAAFYAPLLGMELTWSGPQGAMLAAAGQPKVTFQTIADHVPPRWPDPAYPQQLHLDIQVADLATGERQVLELGATRRPDPEVGSDFWVFADPAGHPFCLVR
ncbi:VOC family protein [Micromonospora sp. NBC_01813]|uniref:VOC family protein n=1 Tax=Micromonospora sp. NBC_01813 TaxID=2975988 RepID=UPI002DDAEF43|nr:VOC family protein [Micromonospora sp. NBC_01813]WSA07787.1 VOC family protein [Micromonospora sp. NBC_01813]